MAWKRQDPTKYKKSQVVLTVVLLILLIVASVVAWVLVKNDKTEVVTTPIEEPVVEVEAPTTEPEPDFDAVALQSAVDEWVNSTSGTSSVVVADESGEVLAAHNSDQVYFAASLYKLFVAYEGYQSLDEIGEVPDTNYLNGQTRQECLDLMIRDSDSPCGEKMLAELGGLELTNKLREYGITNTSMTNISTTAYDSMKVLSLVLLGRGLSEDHQAKYLESMLVQDDLYRRGLPSGFSDQVSVYNKVGWNEQKEWHDAAIVENQNGERLIVVVLTENVGTTKIKELAASVESVITE